MSTAVEKRTGLAAAAQQIDDIATEAMSIFEQPGNFAQEIAVAQAVVDMRKLLTPELMAPVMALMNTDLGFRTDKDPKLSRDPVAPYSVEVVREVFIESKLRGFHTCGNEFNIIAGRFYGAQSGFKRKVRELTKGTFEASIDVPVMSQDGKSAKIKCRATWKMNGDTCNIGVRPEDPCEFLVRVNAFMGADAINGKAERKLLKRVFERITGRTVPDGDTDDAINTTATVKTEPSKPNPKFTAGAETPQPAEVTPPSPAATNTTAPAVSTTTTEPPKETKQTEIAMPRTPQEALGGFMADAGVSFEAFRNWADETDRLPDAGSYDSFDSLPKAWVEQLSKDTKSLNRCIVRCKS